MSLLALTQAASGNPQGATVVTGSAAITNPTLNNLLVTQSSTTAILNWNSFSIGAGESTRFAVPTGGATLNRVTGGDPSAIYGSLSSNGSLYLINPSGIVVGATGRIDTGGSLVLSTYNLSDQQFLAGKDMNFQGTSNAAVQNYGKITSSGGGDIFLIARTVSNSGSISTRGGTVGLAGGTDILISSSDSGDGRVMVRAGSGSVANSGRIKAAVAELRAAGGNMYALAVNNTGVVRATGVVSKGGRVYLTAGSGTVASSGKIYARNVDRSGGKVRITAGSATEPGAIDISGKVNVVGKSGAGGSIVAEAQDVTLGATARLDASGATGGGNIAIGGGLHGQDASMFNAQTVTVASGAQIVADAKGSGNGGLITVWSDDTTNFAGHISAQALGASGDGGFAEVSGRQHLIMQGLADMRSAHGSYGTLLLDPGNVYIQSGGGGNVGPDLFDDAYVVTQLGLGNLVIASSGATGTYGGSPGYIYFQPGVRINWNGATSLILNAADAIYAYENVIIQNTQTGDGSSTFVRPNEGGVFFLAGSHIYLGNGGSSAPVVIGSEFGQNVFMAGVTSFGTVGAGGVVTGVTFGASGSIQVVGSNTNGNTSAQIGYVQPALRGNNTGNDYSAPGVHAANGNIVVQANDQVSVLGGLGVGSFAQIGHGGAAPGNSVADIVSSNISVTANNGYVYLATVGRESGYAQIGHGSYFNAPAGTAVTQGIISGDITVTAAAGIGINQFNNGYDPFNGVTDIFASQIGSGAHVTIGAGGSTVTTGAIEGSISVNSTAGNVVLGFTVSPGNGFDAQNVFSQIGHGATVRIVPTGNGGIDTVTLGAVQNFTDISNNSSYGTGISVTAGGYIQEYSAIIGAQNGQPNITRSQIGSGNNVRIEAANSASIADYSLIVSEGNLTGNITVQTDAVTGNGIYLNSYIQGSNVDANYNMALLSVGHGSFVQLATPYGADSSGAAAVRGGSVTYTEANVLQSAILVQTQNGDNINLSADVVATNNSVYQNRAASRIGSGSDVFLSTGYGGAGGPGVTPYAAANGGDIVYNKGTVWDGFVPVGGPSGYAAYDTSIRVYSGGAITVLTSNQASDGYAVANTTLGRIGHGSTVFLQSGYGGNANQGTNGGRGGDILVTQQTPTRDYGGVNAGADDNAWGLRGQISLAANSPGGTAITVQSLDTASNNQARNNSSSSQIGHGDFISAISGNGGTGGTPWDGTGTPVVGATAFGGRGGHINIDLANMLIESNIVSSDNNSLQGSGGVAGTLTNGTGITGQVYVYSRTANSVSQSAHNWSDATIGHGEAIFALSGNGGSGGGYQNSSGVDTGAFLTNGVAVQTGQAIRDTFMMSAAGAGAATGGNGGDIQVLLGTITNRTGTVAGGLRHDGSADLILSILDGSGGNSLTVKSEINLSIASGAGDDVTATVGARTKVLALGGAGGSGGRGNASLDPFLNSGLTVVDAPVVIQSDVSGGRGGDVMIGVGSGVFGSKTVALNGLANPAPSGAAVIGNVTIKADGQVSVQSLNTVGAYSLTSSTIGNVTDIVGIAQYGGGTDALWGTGGFNVSGAYDGIVNTTSTLPIQIIFNYNNTSNLTTGVAQGVSVLSNGNPDSVASINTARANAGSPSQVKNAMFYDAQGNPEYILNDTTGVLVANNSSNNAAFAASSNSTTFFGRTVGVYNPGISLNNVQYVQLNVGTLGNNATGGIVGRPDLVVGVLAGTAGDARAGMVSVVDVNNNHIYDQISGRVRLADGNLGAFGLLDYTAATGVTPTVTAQNTLSWNPSTVPSNTLAGLVQGSAPVTGLSNPADGLLNNLLGSIPNFSTANGGRGGDVGTAVGWTVGNVVVDAGLVTPTTPYSVLVESRVVGNDPTLFSVGAYNTASAQIGNYAHQVSDTGGYYSNRIAGAAFTTPVNSSQANGASGGGNAVNASGGRGGNASLIQGANRVLNSTSGATEFDFLVGNVLINTNVGGLLGYRPAGVSVSATEDRDGGYNISIARIGHGAFAVAGADNSVVLAGNGPLQQYGNHGGNGNSTSSGASFITLVANGGMGGISSLTQGQIKGLVTAMAGPVPGSDFSIVVLAEKGASTDYGDSQDTVIAQIGSGRLASVAAGYGGTGAAGAYQANGGAGGSATLTQRAILDTAILIDSFTYSNNTGGNGVSVSAIVSEGDTHIVRAQIGHGDIANAFGGNGGGGNSDSTINENLNQTANGGTGGAASIIQGSVIGGALNYINQDITVSAGPSNGGLNAISVTSAVNASFDISSNQRTSGANHVLATIGHGSLAVATAGTGSYSGYDGNNFGTTSGVDPAFYQGLDVANSNATLTGNADTNSLYLGTFRNGGNGGNASITTGAIGFVALSRSTGPFPLSYGLDNPTGLANVSVTAHNFSGGVAGYNGILIEAFGGPGDNSRMIDGNVAMIGHSQFALTYGGGSGYVPNGFGAILTEGNGGNGGAATVTIGNVSGNITVTNVVNGELTNTGTAFDSNITVKSVDQTVYDDGSHTAEARIGSRVSAAASAGYGNNGAYPVPSNATSPATISAMGGNGGAASVTLGAITGNIGVTAENSVQVEAYRSQGDYNVYSSTGPNLLAAIGHSQASNAQAGSGGTGGVQDAYFNTQAILNALRRYADLGQNATAFSRLSAVDQMLVAPLVNGYYAGKDITPLIARIVTAPSAIATYNAGSGTVSLSGLARDDNQVGGTSLITPDLSQAETTTLQALSMANGSGGAASSVQGSITGNITLLGIGADVTTNVPIDTRGVLVEAKNTSPDVYGQQLAHIGHQQDARRVSAGDGADVQQYATGIGGDGGAASSTQFAITGNISIQAGTKDNTGTALTAGTIVVRATDTSANGTTSQAFVGSRQTADSVRGGQGGGNNDPLSVGYLGNGGTATVVQGGMPGLYDGAGNQTGTNDIRFAAYGDVPGVAYSILIGAVADAAPDSGAISIVQVGHYIENGETYGGNAGRYNTGTWGPQGLYGVRQANGGSVSIVQGTLTNAGGTTQSDAIVSTIVLDANKDAIVSSYAGNAFQGNSATVNIGGIMNAYGNAGSGGNAPVQDVATSNGAPGQTSPVAMLGGSVLVAEGGNAFLSQGRMRVTSAAANTLNNPSVLPAGDPLYAVSGTNVINVTSRIGNTSVLAETADSGNAQNYIGQQRNAGMSSGDGGARSGNTQRTAGDSGTVIIARGEMSGDILLQSLAVGSETKVAATTTDGGSALNQIGHVSYMNNNTGQSGYGVDVFATDVGYAGQGGGLDSALGNFVGNANAVYRDAVVAVHDMQNVVSTLTQVNSNASRYSTADQTILTTQLSAANTALTNALAALALNNVGNVKLAATAAKTALDAVNTLVSGIPNYGNEIAAHANAGNIIYSATDPILRSGGIPVGIVNEGFVSGNIVLQAARATNGTYGIGTVAVVSSASGPNNYGGNASNYVGASHSIDNSTGRGGGFHHNSSVDGGVAGNGGSITDSQTTVVGGVTLVSPTVMETLRGNVTLNADTVVVNSNVVGPNYGYAVLQLLGSAYLNNYASEADIVDNLGRGGNITATQNASGTAYINANYLSNDDTLTGNANATRQLLANGNVGGAYIAIGINADSSSYSNSPQDQFGNDRPADSNRGGAITVTQNVTADTAGGNTKSFSLNLDINNTGNVSDLQIAATNTPTGQSDVRIGSRATQYAVSGDSNNGSNVTTTQTVTGDLSITHAEDLRIVVAGDSSVGVHLGHNGDQVAGSGRINDTLNYFGGVTTATQTVTGAIALSATRKFEMSTDTLAQDSIQIGSNAEQYASSASMRSVATGYPGYPIAPSTTTPTVTTSQPLNVISTQTTGGNLSVTAAEIYISNDSNRGIGQPGNYPELGYAPVAYVQFGHAASIIVDTQNNGVASSVSSVTGTIALTTVIPPATPGIDSTFTPVVAGQIGVATSTNGGTAQVGNTSTSNVGHDPSGGQANGKFLTLQSVGDVTNPANTPININAYNTLYVNGLDSGTARIGHYAVESADLLSSPVAAGSRVAQTVSSNINVNAGSYLQVLGFFGGFAQIGHFSPSDNSWQIDGATVVTPQVLSGAITLEVGTQAAKTAVGNATAADITIGSNNAYIAGAFGGSARIGSQFASTLNGTNQTQTAQGDIWLRVGSDLLAVGSNIGHGPYDFNSTAISTDNTVGGLGAVRNRISGLTTIGASQNSPTEDSNTAPGYMVFDGAAINSGYSDSGGQLRFFIPAQQNLTIANSFGTPLFNDSFSTADAVTTRFSDPSNIFAGTGGVTHENGFLPMSNSARYSVTGTGNFAFYFGVVESTVAPPPILFMWDDTHINSGFRAPCVGVVGGGAGGISGGGGGGIANASSFGTSTSSGDACGSGSGGSSGGSGGSDFGNGVTLLAPTGSQTQTADTPPSPQQVQVTVTYRPNEAPLVIMTPVTNFVPTGPVGPPKVNYGSGSSNVLSYALGGPNILSGGR